MKTFKILFAALIFLGFTVTSYAQTDNDNVEVSATILGDIVMTGVDDLLFGNITDETNPFINPDPAVAFDGTVGATAQRGLFELSSTETANVTLEFTVANDMTDGDAENSIWFHALVYHTEEESEIEDGTDFISNGNENFHIGGRLSGDQNDSETNISAGPGEYTVDFTLTAEYN